MATLPNHSESQSASRGLGVLVWSYVRFGKVVIDRLKRYKAELDESA
jgi:hypothetical protein